MFLYVHRLLQEYSFQSCLMDSIGNCFRNLVWKTTNVVFFSETPAFFSEILQNVVKEISSGLSVIPTYFHTSSSRWMFTDFLWNSARNYFIIFSRDLLKKSFWKHLQLFLQSFQQWLLQKWFLKFLHEFMWILQKIFQKFLQKHKQVFFFQNSTRNFR